VVSKPALELRIGDDQAGLRVEQLVMSAAHCSRTEARALCEAGAVRLNGRRASKGLRAADGDELSIILPESAIPLDADVELDVRLEREDLVVVRKPAGMPSAPLSLNERGTLANALLARYPEMANVGYTTREPGLVHRLDTETSGLIIAARTVNAFKQLKAALQRGALKKSYLAVVPQAGLPDQGSIKAELKPDPNRKGRVVVSTDLGDYSRTTVSTFDVRERGAHYALVEVAASPAFRHQVRVHLATQGHPIVGDALYGGASEPSLGARHALHAHYVAWAGDGMPSFEVTDAAPSEFLDLVRGAPAAS